MTPVEPEKKAIGPKTADSTSPMPIRALVICSIDLAVASRGESPSSLMMRSTFSTTTMASSTSRPMASTMANIVSMLMEKPNKPSAANVPSRTTGTAIVGIKRGADVPHEQTHHEEDQHDRLEKGLHDFLDGHLDERSRVIGIDHLHSVREVAAHLFQLGLDGIGGLQGVGAGAWRMAMPAAGLPL